MSQKNAGLNTRITDKAKAQLKALAAHEDRTMTKFIEMTVDRLHEELPESAKAKVD